MPEHQQNYLDLVRLLMPILRLALYNARSYEKLCNTERELRKSKIELEQRVKERTQELQKSESRFRNILDHAPIGMVITTPDGQLMQANDAFCAILRYEKHELEKLTISAITYHEDIASSLANIKLLLDGKVNSYKSEKRYLCKDGQVVWAQLTASIEKNNLGAPQYLIGQVEDITKRKQLDNSLLKFSLAIEQSPSSVVITDLDANIEFVNNAFVKTTGYNLVETIGKNPRMVQSGKTPKSTYDEMWTNLIRGEIWEGELINKRKDGSEYIEFTRIAPVRQTDGSITHYLAVKEDITERKALMDEIKSLAFYDPLTGLPNRRLLVERLKQIIISKRRENKQFAVMMVDLDEFKAANDIFGHAAGDELLKQVAQRMTKILRESDTVARLGGDEFVVLLEDIAQPNDAARVAEEIIADLLKPFFLSQNKSVQIGASIGISLYPQHSDNGDVLMIKADTALYAAKHKGRGCFVCYSEDITCASQ